jgi:site-specific recombinase XerD
MPSIILSNVFDYQAILDIEFSSYLTSQHASEITRKNYVADLHTFFKWFVEQIRQGLQTRTHEEKPLRDISTESLETYKRALLVSHTPTATINRRLSALRIFFQFAISQNLIQENPMLQVRNLPRNDDQNSQLSTVTSGLSESNMPLPVNRQYEMDFSAFLSQQHVSDVTRKNYLTDFRNFLTWLTSTGKNIGAVLKTVTAETLETYKQSLIFAQTPIATINRRLSTVRLFFQCAILNKWILNNPTGIVRNIPSNEALFTASSLDEALTVYISTSKYTSVTKEDVETIKSFFSWRHNQQIS